jgi:hypothetical protein
VGTPGTRFGLCRGLASASRGDSWDTLLQIPDHLDSWDSFQVGGDLFWVCEDSLGTTEPAVQADQLPMLPPQDRRIEREAGRKGELDFFKCVQYHKSGLWTNVFLPRGIIPAQMRSWNWTTQWLPRRMTTEIQSSFT